MKGVLCILLVCLRHQPLLQQILGHLYLLWRARYGDDAIIGTGQGLIYGYIRARFVAYATNPTATLANDGTSQLHEKERDRERNGLILAEIRGMHFHYLRPWVL